MGEDCHYLFARDTRNLRQINFDFQKDILIENQKVPKPFVNLEESLFEVIGLGFEILWILLVRIRQVFCLKPKDLS
jgi:hypothetical protein